MSSETNSPVTRQGAAYNPVTHFVLVPVFTITFAIAIDVARHAQQHRLLHWWMVVVAFSFVLLTMQQRLYALRVQDRVIRLEERLRVMTLVPGVDGSRLSMRQLIALRFAPDGELPSLVHRALAENLDGAQIKAATTEWRRDDVRI